MTRRRHTKVVHLVWNSFGVVVGICRPVAFVVAAARKGKPMFFLLFLAH
jgi:hypothetical protein